LSNEIQRLVSDFNTRHPDIHVTPSYTGSYDDTNLKTHAAIQAGHAPAVVLMSANFVREYAITGDAVSLDPFIAAGGETDAQFMDKFFPALRINAMRPGRSMACRFRTRRP
jgi:sn-glycerol 3-phosphate transport system substrate-binding protein